MSGAPNTVWAAALLLAACVSASALPVMPDGYTATLNTTVQFSGGQTMNTMQTAYQGFNSSLTVTYRPGPTPYQLADGDDQTAVKYNPATRTCDATCIGGTVCPGGKCGVYGAGLFGPLPATKAAGDCTFNIEGAIAYTLEIASAHLALEYCFVGNTPAYILEKVTTSAPAGLSQGGRHKSPLFQTTEAVLAMDGKSFDTLATDGASVDVVLMVVQSLDPATPSPDVFDVPPYCTCASS